MSPRSLLAPLVLVVVALGGCSAEVHIGGYDASKVAGQIKAAQEKTAPDMEVSRASCPKDPGKLEKGLTFECSVTIEGVQAPYTVKVTSVKDDTAHFHFEPAKAIISVDKAQQFLAQQVDSSVRVTCPKGPVLVQEPGSTFACTLSKGAATQQVKILVKDTDGNISVQN